MKICIFAIACAALFVSGCAAGKINLRETGEINVDIHHTEAIHIEEVSIYEVEGGIEVSGLVRRHKQSLPSKGIIEIIVTGPDGKVLAAVETEYVIKKRISMHRRSILSRTGPEEGRFSKQIKVVPPKGSAILLTIR